MKPDHFSTPRLAVRNWRDDITDPSRRAALERTLKSLLTPPVLAHLPPSLHLDEPPGGISAWIDARAAESDVLLVQAREGQVLLGLLILACDEDSATLPTMHLGYLLAEAAWGQGIASELIAGLIAAITVSRPMRLIGGVDIGNPASARVLEKAGFARDLDLSTPDIGIYVLKMRPGDN